MADNTTQQPTDAGATAEEGAAGGFSEAFAERAKHPEGGADEGSQAGADDASANTDGSADQAGSETAPPSGAAEDGSGTNAQAFDPFAGLSPEQKAHFEKLAASERSQRGRVGALTKKLNSITTIGSGTQKPPEGQDGEGGDGTQGGEGEGSQAGTLEGKLKAIAEGEYSDVVGPVAEVVADLRKEIADLKASATRHEVDQDAAELTEAYAKLEEKHPDYAQVAGSQEFQAWAGKQEPKVLALLNSYDPEEVSLGLQLYKAESKASSTVAGEEGQGGDGSAATGERRQRQLDGLKQPTARGAPAAAGVPNDFRAAFRQRAGQKV